MAGVGKVPGTVIPIIVAQAKPKVDKRRADQRKRVAHRDL
jgi:hypothetical protein